MNNKIKIILYWISIFIITIILRNARNFIAWTFIYPTPNRGLYYNIMSTLRTFIYVAPYRIFMDVIIFSFLFFIRRYLKGWWALFFPTIVIIALLFTDIDHIIRLNVNNTEWANVYGMTIEPAIFSVAMFIFGFALQNKLFKKI